MILLPGRGPINGSGEFAVAAVKINVASLLLLKWKWMLAAAAATSFFHESFENLPEFSYISMSTETLYMCKASNFAGAKYVRIQNLPKSN